jgi:hypothetical protein
LTEAQKKAAKPPPPLVGVALNPRTLRPLKSPQTGARAVYGTLDTRTGVIKPLESSNAQKYGKGEFKKLNRELRRVGSGDLVVYEEKSNIRLRDQEGRPVVSTKGEKRYELKQRFGKPVKTVWRPVLYDDSTYVRPIDPRFTERSPREMIDAALMQEAVRDPVNKRVFHAADTVLEGDTLKDALNKIQLPVSYEELDKQGMQGAKMTATLDIDGEKIKVDVMSPDFSDFTNKIAAGVRSQLSEKGIRYTSMKNLKKYGAENRKKYKQLMKEGKTLDRRRDKVHADWTKSKGKAKAKLKREMDGLDTQLDQLGYGPGGIVRPNSKIDRLYTAAESTKRHRDIDTSKMRQARNVKISDIEFELRPKGKD